MSTPTWDSGWEDQDETSAECCLKDSPQSSFATKPQDCIWYSWSPESAMPPRQPAAGTRQNAGAPNQIPADGLRSDRCPRQELRVRTAAWCLPLQSVQG